MKKILVLLILLILVFILYSQSSKEELSTDEDEISLEKKAVEKKQPTIKGQSVNVSQIPNNEVEPPLSRNLRARLPPDFQVVFSNLSSWNGSLTAEDFQVIRNLKSKIDNKQFFDVNDVAGINHLDDKNILNAIKQNNPALISNQANNQEENTQDNYQIDNPADNQIQATEEYNSEYIPEPEPIQELQPEVENYSNDENYN